jgi:hypothetical protein
MNLQAPQWMADDSEGLLAALAEAAEGSTIPHPTGLVGDTTSLWQICDVDLLMHSFGR